MGATLPAGTTKSGSALADFDSGLDLQFYQDNGRKIDLRVNRPSLYVQDDWKANRKLTLNLGVRWDPWLPPNDFERYPGRVQAGGSVDSSARCTIRTSLQR